MKRTTGTRGALAVTVALCAAAFVLASCLLAACGGPAGERSPAATAASATPAPLRGGTYRHPLQADPGSLLPSGIVDSMAVTSQIYEGLVAYDTLEDGSFVTVPCLAESWTANADATVWTFRLRRGVRFQQPLLTEVTAADVVAVFRYSADPRNEADVAYMNTLLAGADAEGHARAGELGVEALGRYTVRFVLKEPFAAFPDTLGHPWAWVWPVDHVQRVGRRAFEARPVGTGPFTLARRVPGEYVDLARNAYWWRAPSGQPYVDGVHFRVVKSVSAELQAAQNGLVDCVSIPQGQVEESRSLPQVVSGAWVPRTLPRLTMSYLGFGMKDPVVGGDHGLPIRQAVDCAIDRDALVEVLSESVLVPQTGLVPPAFPAWRDQPRQAYDPARARRLYEEAGSPELRLIVPDFRDMVAVGTWLSESCAAAGIHVRPETLHWEDYIAEIDDGTAQLFLIGWAADYPSPDAFLYDLHHSGLSSQTSGTSYSDPDVDRLLTIARSTADPGRHLDLERRAAREIAADLPLIPLWEHADYRLLDERVRGFSAGPEGQIAMWELWLE